MHVSGNYTAIHEKWQPNFLSAVFSRNVSWNFLRKNTHSTLQYNECISNLEWSVVKCDWESRWWWEQFQMKFRTKCHIFILKTSIYWKYVPSICTAYLPNVSIDKYGPSTHWQIPLETEIVSADRRSWKWNIPLRANYTFLQIWIAGHLTSICDKKLTHAHWFMSNKFMSYKWILRNSTPKIWTIHQQNR